MKTPIIFAWVTALVVQSVPAAVRTSANYQIPAEAVGLSTQLAGSPHYSNLASLGGVGGPTTNASGVNAMQDYLGQVVNTAPMLATITDQEIAAGQTWRLTVSASDADLPANALIFSLEPGAPAGASIDPTTGLLTWTPTEAQLPGPYAITVRVTDDGSPPLSGTTSFMVIVTGVADLIAGQWDFDRGDLSATLGLPLEYMGGVNGPTFTQTQFGTTSSFGIADVNGVPAQVMRFGGASSAQIGYILRHAAAPNGALNATKINQWTLIMDLLIPNAQGQSWFSFVQIDESNNSSDGDLFAQFSGGVAGIGITGQYAGALTAGHWHRVAFAVDAASVISKYIDGIKVADQSDWDGRGLDGRHALQPTALLFADDNGESQEAYFNSIQFRSYKMSDAEITALGGPTADGIASTGFNNRPPVLAAIPDWQITEHSALSFTVSATDPDLPANTLTYSLEPGAPAGVGIDRATGLFTWTPTEAQGPSTNIITVRVADDGQPSLSHTRSFNVIVRETNSAPILTAMANQRVHAGSTLRLQLTATDADLPPNRLSYSLVQGPPEATITSAPEGSERVFTWTPTEAQVGTFSATIRVTDDGIPSLWDEKRFDIMVNPRAAFGSIQVTENGVRISWSAVPGQIYRVQYKSRLDQGEWIDLPGDVIATGPTASQEDTTGLVAQRFYRIQY